MPKATDHERNDRIEASVMMAALATLGLLVALAVSTSMTALTGPDLHATAPEVSPETASDSGGIVGSDAQLQGSELR